MKKLLNEQNIFALRKIRTLVQKELQSYVDTPTMYLIFVVFLLVWEYLFFRNVFLVGENSLSELFGIFPWLALLFIPAVTMGSFSKEKDAGTLEFLLTRPITISELVLSKF